MMPSFPRCAVPSVLLALSLLAPSARAQSQNQNQAHPPLEEYRKTFEEMFQAAVDFADSDEHRARDLQMAWGPVMVSAAVLANREHLENGAPAPGDETALAVIDRWQELRPQHPGPAILRLQAAQPNAQEWARATLELADRHPESLLVVDLASQFLRNAGDDETATALLESFAQRHADRSVAFEMLAEHFRTLGSTTEAAANLRRWAARHPGDPKLVQTWRSSVLGRTQPDETAAVVTRFLETQPGGRATLGICTQLAKQSESAAGRECLARLANEDADEEVARGAREALAQLALASGDTAAFEQHLATLDGPQQVEALLGAARQARAPEECSTKLELLRTAASGAKEDQTLADIVSAARDCRGRAEAQQLFLDLLRRSSAERIDSLVSRWTLKVNGNWHGSYPPETSAIIERHLEAGSPPDAVYRALDLVFDVQQDAERRFLNLDRWRRADPLALRSEQAVLLAWALVERGRLDEAKELLERRSRQMFAPEEIETTWALAMLGEGGDDVSSAARSFEQADRLAARLRVSENPQRRSYGYVFAARSAWARDDAAEAASHYRAAVAASDPPNEKVVQEFLQWLAASGGDSPADVLTEVADAAIEVCESTQLGGRQGGTMPCARHHLLESGLGAAVEVLAEIDEVLPSRPRDLVQLALRAQSMSQLDLAERAWRRVLDVDPQDPSHWGSYAVFLEKAGEHERLERLLDRARNELRETPSSVLRAVGRSRTARELPAKAIEILEEARAMIERPQWLDRELGDAHTVLAVLNERASAEEGKDAEALRAEARAVLWGDEGECLEGLAKVGELAAESRAAAGLLGRFHLFGLGSCVPESRESALTHLEFAAETGELEASFNLGLALFEGARSAAQRDRGLELLDRLGQAPYPAALELLAFVHAAGVRIPANPERARELRQQAFTLGSDGWARLRGQSSLPLFGRLFSEGIERLERSVEDGDLEATTALAAALLRGPWTLADRPLRDAARGLELARRAASADDPWAVRLVADALYNGEGTNEAPHDAIRWYRRGAELGEPWSMHQYALGLLEGKHTETDRSTGLEWLVRAAEIGHWQSMGLLGRAHADGLYGLDRDPEAAAPWMSRRAALGDQRARGWLLAYGFEEP